MSLPGRGSDAQSALVYIGPEKPRLDARSRTVEFLCQVSRDGPGLSPSQTKAFCKLRNLPKPSDSQGFMDASWLVIERVDPGTASGNVGERIPVFKYSNWFSCWIPKLGQRIL